MSALGYCLYKTGNMASSDSDAVINDKSPTTTNPDEDDTVEDVSRSVSFYYFIILSLFALVNTIRIARDCYRLVLEQTISFLYNLCVRSLFCFDVNVLRFFILGKRSRRSLQSQKVAG